MKRILLTTLAVVILIPALLLSCGKNSKAYKELQSEYDSIHTAYQSNIAELDSIVGLILENFQEINHMEGLIDVNRLQNDVKVDQATQIESNMQVIKSRLEENRSQIEKLNEKLKGSGANVAKLKKTVGVLEKQLNQKTDEIRLLTEELERKDIKIKELDEQVVALNKDMATSQETIDQQKKTIEAQDKEYHTVRYCVGTRADLEDMNIIRGGKLATEDYESDYFRKVDMREFSTLPLYAKRAKLLTDHPASSYKLSKGADKKLVLEILDQELFWSHSKVLVVRVN